MFGIKWRPKRPISRFGLADAVADGIRARPDLTHLYLMYQEGGTITVQREGQGWKRRRSYRIEGDERTGEACPHCAVLHAVERLATALPLDEERIERTCCQYDSVVRQGMLPCASFGRSPTIDTPFGPMPVIIPDPGWMAECHVARGNPHTAADCVRHRESAEQ
ncbi:MAG TPA: hypothetical protein VI076_17555 [Actinopolymorphaceae bacterium]